MITALREADCVVLVTEPTPFGLHDLSLAVETVRELEIPFGVVINRIGIGDNRVHAFCGQEGIPILLEIPDDRRIAEAYSRGDLLVDIVPGYRRSMETLWERTVACQQAEHRRHAQTTPPQVRTEASQ
jgi:MinD superfamily P-loop ATPase